MEINTETLLTIVGLFIAAISLLFTIFTAAIAFVAIWEWKSVHNFRKTMRAAENKYSQMANDAKEFNLVKIEAAAFLEASKKAGKETQNEKQKQQFDELVKKMNRIVDSAENKLITMENSAPLTVSGLSGTYSVSGANLSNVSSFIGFSHPCKKCGKYYARRMTEYDDGHCDDCKKNN
jgi:hypothetical protein